MIYDRQS